MTQTLSAPPLAQSLEERLTQADDPEITPLLKAVYQTLERTTEGGIGKLDQESLQTLFTNLRDRFKDHKKNGAVKGVENPEFLDIGSLHAIIRFQAQKAFPEMRRQDLFIRALDTPVCQAVREIKNGRGAVARLATDEAATAAVR